MKRPEDAVQSLRIIRFTLQRQHPCLDTSQVLPSLDQKSLHQFGIVGQFGRGSITLSLFVQRPLKRDERTADRLYFQGSGYTPLRKIDYLARSLPRVRGCALPKVFTHGGEQALQRLERPRMRSCQALGLQYPVDLMR